MNLNLERAMFGSSDFVELRAILLSFEDGGRRDSHLGHWWRCLGTGGAAYLKKHLFLFFKKFLTLSTYFLA
jgi:hypothetical protein